MSNKSPDSQSTPAPKPRQLLEKLLPFLKDLGHDRSKTLDPPSPAKAPEAHQKIPGIPELLTAASAFQQVLAPCEKIIPTLPPGHSQYIEDVKTLLEMINSAIRNDSTLPFGISNEEIRSEDIQKFMTIFETATQYLLSIQIPGTEGAATGRAVIDLAQNLVGNTRSADSAQNIERN